MFNRKSKGERDLNLDFIPLKEKQQPQNQAFFVTQNENFHFIFVKKLQQLLAQKLSPDGTFNIHGT